MRTAYDRHDLEWRRVLEDPERRRVGESWFAEDTLDAWRHRRMRSLLQPLIASGLHKSWITIGDGRFGTDAHYLMAAGVRDVTATDLFDDLLRIGAERGFIGKFAAQNAEALSFPDESFDLVYCKESYHHLPRPYLALYEMLRVCREAVVLTEPNDPAARRGRLFTALKRLLGRPTDGHSFESVGNYIYYVCEREIEKVMLGVGLRHCAFAYMNDCYIEGVEFVPASGGTPKERLVRAKLKGLVAARNVLCKLNLRPPDIVTAVLFKRVPEPSMLDAMRVAGFAVKELPRNPYLKT